MKKFVVVVLAFCAGLFIGNSQAQSSHVIGVLKAKIKASPHYLGAAWPKNLDHLTSFFLMRTFPEVFFPVTIFHFTMSYFSTETLTLAKDLDHSMRILQKLRLMDKEKLKEYKLLTCSGEYYDPKYTTWDIDEDIKSYLSGNISLSKAIFLLWEWYNDECETFDELAETILGNCNLFTKEDFAQDLSRINASIPDSIKAIIVANVLIQKRTHGILTKTSNLV